MGGKDRRWGRPSRNFTGGTSDEQKDLSRLEKKVAKILVSQTGEISSSRIIVTTTTHWGKKEKEERNDGRIDAQQGVLQSLQGETRGESIREGCPEIHTAQAKRSSSDSERAGGHRRENLHWERREVGKSGNRRS